MNSIRTVKMLTVMALVCGRLAATEPAADKDARARAALYQAETRTEMESMHWRVITDAPGRLVGTQSRAINGPGDAIASFSLIVTFRPKSRTDTECGINKLMTLYVLPNTSPSRRELLGPVPQTDTQSLKEVNSILARARQRLLKAHPEYAAPASH